MGRVEKGLSDESSKKERRVESNLNDWECRDRLRAGRVGYSRDVVALDVGLQAVPPFDDS